MVSPSRRRLAFLQTLALLLSYRLAALADKESNSQSPTTVKSREDSCLHIYDDDDDDGEEERRSGVCEVEQVVSHDDVDDQQHDDAPSQQQQQQHSHQLIQRRHPQTIQEIQQQQPDPSILVISTVDGMLAGLSRSTGEVLWKQPPNPPAPHSYRMHGERSSQYTPLLDPWVSTTSSTTSQKSASTFAIPSILDGKVYITVTSSSTSDDNDNDTVEEMAADIPQLVARAPFVDDRGRTFTATKQTSVTTLDVRTGAIEDNSNSSTHTHHGVWVGRVDSHVTMHQKKGPDVEFSYAELQSVQEMALRNTHDAVEEWNTGDHSLMSSSRTATHNTAGMIWGTPSGLIAFLPPSHDHDTQIAWVTQLPAPVAAALDATGGGRRLPIHMIPDAKMPSMDPFAAALQQEYYTTTMIVGSLKDSGQPFAMPLRVVSTPHRTTHAGAVLLPATKKHQDSSACEPGSSTFPRCLTRALLDLSSSAPHDDDEGGILPYYHDFNAYDVYHRTPHQNSQRQKQRQHHKHNNPRPRTPPRKINTGYLYPTLLALLVAFFEVGRRIRDRDRAAAAVPVPLKESPPPPRDAMIIQVQEDVVLGHGGGGTMVYQGILDGRKVAVKRMLKTYHASADREISLLIESDGHPNVVRYFLKELRGDFVYLALELCDVSLHDLIGQLRNNHQNTTTDNTATDNAVESTRKILFQIVQGVAHLHRLRIVHRDLKPANILLASTKKRKTDSCYQTFERGDYIAKISDMGLGKQLVGHSSYGGSLVNDSSLRASRSSNGGHSSVAGVGAGSVGWQAPEVMAMRHHSSDASVKSEGSSDPIADLSPIDISPNARTSRSVDIFSLGCIFYSTLVPGCHPFGEWYEREANIMHNRPNLDQLKLTMPDAYDLVKSMLSRTPSSRPTSKQVAEHPYFWSPERRLAFLCDFSDRLENDFSNCTETGRGSARLFAVERDAADVVGASWNKRLDDALVSNVQKWRSYDSSAIRDLLRLIRNKYHHFDELPAEFKESIGTKADGLMKYFEKRFPKLVIHCHGVCSTLYGPDDSICEKYSIRPTLPKKTQPEKDPGTCLSHSNVLKREEQAIPAETETSLAALSENESSPELAPVLEESTVEDLPEPNREEDALIVDQLVVWHGSAAANALKCRGWNRGDDDWTRSGSESVSRRAKDLIRSSEDPRYRTRLCNHWDVSLGSFCPMQKKGKCIFAHGPVELRVKDGKRKRWGRLVDSNGNCNNPKASGGEDTYGAARAIETERKQEGKWNTDKKPQKRKQQSTVNKKAPRRTITAEPRDSTNSTVE